MSNSLQSHGLTRLFCPWNFSRQEYESRLPFFSPGNLPDLGGANLGLLNCRQILYHLSQAVPCVAKANHYTWALDSTLWTFPEAHNAIQPSHPLLPSSPSALNLSQHQSLFQWVGSLHQVAKVLELQLQHQSFQWIFTVPFPLALTSLISFSFRIDCLISPYPTDSQEPYK